MRKERRTDGTDRQTWTRLIIVLPNFANARKNGHFKASLVLRIQSGVTGKNVGSILDFVKDLFLCRFLTCISISHG